MSYKLKFNYNGIFRRTSLESLSHESVEKAAREVFAIPPTLLVTLTWTDEEGDVVFVSSENEFQEFMDSKKASPVSGFMYAGGLPADTVPDLYKFGVVTEAMAVAAPTPPPPAPTRAIPTPAAQRGAYGPSAVHSHVSCDACGVGPIVGIRYKCTGRDDFDLCADCEKKAEQPFPMLKMYEPRVGMRLKVKGQGFGPIRGCKRHGGGGGGCGGHSDSDATGRPHPPHHQHHHPPIPTPPPYTESGPVVHEGVTCNECSVGPIIGTRYKCTGRDDFDLCSACEASVVAQPFPMIKIYRPDISVQVKGWGTQGKRCPANPFGFKQSPFGPSSGPRCGGGRWRGCGQQGPPPTGTHSSDRWPRQTDVAEVIASVVNNIAPVVGSACDAAESFMKDIDEQILKQTMDISMNDKKAAPTSTTTGDATTAPAPAPKEEPAEAKDSSSNTSSPASSFSVSNIRGYALKPMARFVGDVTIPDATVVEPSTDFVKIWLVRNDGPCDWPTDGTGVRLITAGGDPMSLHWDSLSIPVESIKVGEETHISVTLKSPPSPGRYVSYFRLQAADGTVFGQKLWVDIRVQVNLSGHVGFTSPAFAIPKQAAPVKDAGTSGLEFKPDLPVTYATSSSGPSSTVPFTPSPTEASDAEAAAAAGDSSVEMEYPGGEFEDLANTLVDELSVDPDTDPATAPAVDNEDALWSANREEMERDWKVELDALKGMGFHNVRENVKLLKKHTKTSFSRFPQLQGKPFSDSLSTILDALLN